MKKFMSLAAAAALSLAYVPSTLGRMIDQVLTKESALYKTISVRSRQMNVKVTTKKKVMHRVTARTTREKKVFQDMKKPVRMHPVRGYFVPKSSSSSSSMNSVASTSSAGSTSSAASSAASSH